MEAQTEGLAHHLSQITYLRVLYDHKANYISFWRPPEGRIAGDGQYSVPDTPPQWAWVSRRCQIAPDAGSDFLPATGLDLHWRTHLHPGPSCVAPFRWLLPPICGWPATRPPTRALAPEGSPDQPGHPIDGRRRGPTANTTSHDDARFRFSIAPAPSRRAGGQYAPGMVNGLWARGGSAPLSARLSARHSVGMERGRFDRGSSSSRAPLA